MRIALVHPYSWPDVRRGGERYLSDLAWWLASRGHDVHVVTGTRGTPGTEHSAGVTVIRRRHVHPNALARRGVSPLDTFGAVAVAPLRRGRYDVVHALTPTAAIAGRLARCPTVYTVIGHPTPGQFRRRPFDRSLVAAGVKAADVVTALSEASARQVEEMFGRVPDVVPPGVRLDVFRPGAARHDAADPTVLFPADASDPRKGVHVTLAAFGRLLERRPDARLVLGGPGDHTWAVHGLGSDARRILAAVDVVGPGDLAALPDRYRAASVTVLPSRHEAFGLVLAESLACGTPVVGAEEGGIPDVVHDRATGRLVAPGDIGALADALADMIDVAARPGTVDACVAAAQRFGWAERVGALHEAVYERVAR